MHTVTRCNNKGAAIAQIYAQIHRHLQWFTYPEASSQSLHVVTESDTVTRSLNDITHEIKMLWYHRMLIQVSASKN